MVTISPETQQFISLHSGDDVRQLALKGCKSAAVDLPFALQQIAGRQTARRKLPSWTATEGIVYPPHLSMEQCSSEATARYKGRLIARLVAAEGGSDGGGRKGRGTLRFVDLTGGLGVDFAFISQCLGHVANETNETYVEQNPQLCAISSHNFPLLNVQAEVVCADAADYLRQLPQADIIYLDPARRDAHGAKTFALSDCTPDVTLLRDELLAKSRFTVVKLSPMLDWHEAVRALKEVSEVHIVGTEGECKELLMVMQRGSGRQFITCANDEETFCFWSDEMGENEVCLAENDLKSAFAAGAMLYLYEPNATLMKAGCYGVLAQRYGVCALERNSHLFVSRQRHDAFPGRKFQISAISSMNKRELRQALNGIERANVAVRNFPMKAEELRQRLKLKDGGSNFIFGTTLADGQHRLLLCKPLS